MMSIKKLAVVTLTVALCHPFAFAADEVTPQQAVSLVGKAVTYLKQNGKDKALVEFNNPKGQFIERELYIAVMDMNGMILASGGNAKLIGKNLLDVKDVNGKQFVREEIEVARTKGKGEVAFEWLNPVAQKLEPRTAYVERVDDVVVLTVYPRRAR